MTEDIVAYSLSKHPAPHRAKVGCVALYYGVAAAPVFWAADLVIDYALVGHGCYPGRMPLAQPTFAALWPLTLGIHLLALVLIASSALTAYRNWRVTGPPENHSHHLMERGEGRTRFLGIVGMSFGVMFFLVTAAETFSMAWVPLCTH